VTTDEGDPAVGLDTSVVLRLLTGEPPRQADRAMELVGELRQADRPVLVSDLVVAEAYYALHAHYDVPKRKALAALLDLLESELVAPEPGGCSLATLRTAVSASARPGFVDRLLHAQYRRGQAQVASFERAFGRLDGALVLKA